MSKFNEILNSSDASDALLGEQIDKIADFTDKSVDGWVRTDLTINASASSFFNIAQSSIIQYYNATTRKIAIYIDLVAAKALTTSDNVPTIAWISGGLNPTHTANGSAGSETSLWSLIKWGGKGASTGITLKPMVGTVASGSHLYGFIEYTIVVPVVSG